LPDLILVGIAISTIDQPISSLKRNVDCFADLARRGLPSPCSDVRRVQAPGAFHGRGNIEKHTKADSRDFLAGVELVSLVGHGSRALTSDRSLRHELGNEAKA
jgi:hypothetical protein